MLPSLEPHRNVGFIHSGDSIQLDNKQVVRPDVALSYPADKPMMMILDGHSLAFRSYHAFSCSRDGGVRSSTDIPTSVCFGFLKLLVDNLEAQRPDYVAITFDLVEPTPLCHGLIDDGKAGRAETPEDFAEAVDNLRALLGAFQLSIFSVSGGHKADDMIGTLAVRAKAKGYQVKILSRDQNLFQLIDPEENIKVMYLSTPFGSTTGTTKEYGYAEVYEKLLILPSQVTDYKALCGHTSDNIPGVQGIGKQKAIQLLDTYGDLDTIYNSLDEMKGAVRKHLETGKADAEQSKFLATIKTDVPIETDLEICKLEGFNPEDVTPALRRLELHHFENQLGRLQTVFGGESDYQPRTETKLEPEKFEDEDLAFFSTEETGAEDHIELGAVDIQPVVVTTAKQLKELTTKLKKQTDAQRPVAWDTETTSFDPLEAELIGIGCCWGEASTELAYIPVGHVEGEQLSAEQVLNALQPILEDKQYPKAFQNAKYDRLVLRRAGVTLAGVVFDTMLASYVLNPDASHNLTALSLRFLELTTLSYADLVPNGKTVGDIAIAEVTQYCGSDVHTTYRLVPLLRAELAKYSELETLYAEMELPVEPVLANMEATGIRIDKAYLNELSKQLEDDLTRIEAAAYEAAGEKFNLGSPKQLSTLFFETLGLDKRKSRKTKTGYSTDASTLEKLQGDHPVVDSVVKYRTISKLKSTYIDALPALIQLNTGRVHTNFNQAVTATGRLSSSNPNLQNIPIRTAFSRQIRQAFLPKEGWLLVAADYSQVELRILAHLSEEPILVKAYKENDDVHRLTATLLFDKDKKEITADERRIAKVVNFGVIYGMGATRFAREMGVPRAEAKGFIERFNSRYPKVFEYLQQMQREAIAHGYVKTITGRRRYFNFTTRAVDLVQKRGV